jgi:hypothetical protein
MNEYTYDFIEADESTLTPAKVKRTNPDDSVTWIPLDPANSDYQAYLAQLENEGI